jgi:hypothetical protein
MLCHAKQNASPWQEPTPTQFSAINLLIAPVSSISVLVESLWTFRALKVFLTPFWPFFTFLYFRPFALASSVFGPGRFQKTPYALVAASFPEVSILH